MPGHRGLTLLKPRLIIAQTIACMHNVWKIDMNDRLCSRETLGDISTSPPIAHLAFVYNARK